MEVTLHWQNSARHSEVVLQSNCTNLEDASLIHVFSPIMNQNMHRATGSATIKRTWLQHLIPYRISTTVPLHFTRTLLHEMYNF